MDEIYCEDCGAYYPGDCFCAGNQAMLAEMHAGIEESKTWRGMDGHLYEGDPKRASMAMHRDDCGCPGSVNFDPESWY